MTPLRDDPPSPHDRPGSFDDFTRSRSAFFETLRRDAEFRRVVAAFALPASPDHPRPDGLPSPDGAEPPAEGPSAPPASGGVGRDATLGASRRRDRRP